MKPADPVYFPCAPGPVAASPGFGRFQSLLEKLINIDETKFKFNLNR